MTFTNVVYFTQNVRDIFSWCAVLPTAYDFTLDGWFYTINSNFTTVYVLTQSVWPVYAFFNANSILLMRRFGCKISQPQMKWQIWGTGILYIYWMKLLHYFSCLDPDWHWDSLQCTTDFSMANWTWSSRNLQWMHQLLVHPISSWACVCFITSPLAPPWDDPWDGQKRK